MKSNHYIQLIVLIGNLVVGTYLAYIIANQKFAPIENLEVQYDYYYPAKTTRFIERC